MKDHTFDDHVAAGQGVGQALKAKAGEHRMARRRADVDPDRPEDDVVRLTLLELTGQCAGVDGLVVVVWRLDQAGGVGNTPAIVERIPLARSSSS